MAPLDRRASHGSAFELVIQDDALVVLHAQQPRCLLLPRGRVDASSPLALTTDDASDFRSVHGRRMGFDAIYGIFHLLRGPYLALVTQSRVVGRGVDDKEIRRVEKLELMLIPTQQLPLLTPTQEEDEATYMDMLTSDIETQQLHFSRDYDLTHSLQRIAGFDPKTRSNSRAIAERADRRFCWNYGLCQPFIDQKLWEWITPMMQAHVEVADRLTVRDASFKIVYISRRSARRQGCRFTMRGIDAEGNVANFVETEQICLFTDGRQTSFVQIRGSIPVYWSSPVTMKYAPTVYQRNVLSHDVAAFQRHADELRTLYGRVVMVNLIDKKREQLRLGEAFAKTVAQAATQDKHVLANVRLVWFDFHHECRGMQWQHLAKLIQQVDDDFQGHGFFSRGADGTVLATQSGVVRTNCMDNLDRTNVVQSLFARRSVLLQLGESDALQGDVLSSPFDAFETVFKNVWGNNADAISLFYAGTGALKTDFTRTGKRTKMGALMDGYNSCMRYFLNNFRDGYRQDVVDLLLGKYVVSRSKPSPFRQSDGDRETLESFLVKVLGVVGVFFFIESVRSGLAFVFHNLFKATLWTLLVGAAVLGQQLKKGTALGQRLVQPPRFRPQDGCMVAWKK